MSSTRSQPYLLQLYGDPNAYGIAGLAAALVAGAQIVGGLLVPGCGASSGCAPMRCSLGGVLTSCCSCCIGLTTNFVVALVLLAVVVPRLRVRGPIRQAFINGLIPSEQRATVLSASTR